MTREHPAWTTPLDGSRVLDALSRREPIIVDDLFVRVSPRE
ncbi:MAG: hypothetical protein QM736_17860 [Vicinamibacterales bacterium]